MNAERLAARRWDQFWSHVDVNPYGCWVWTASRYPEGYGHAYAGLGTPLAHRVSYTWLVGPIPEGMQLDHLCVNPPCVNPLHLEPVTAFENTRRSPRTRASINASRTHCPQGHPYDEENTRWISPPSFNGRWGRQCRACSNGRGRTERKVA